MKRFASALFALVLLACTLPVLADGRHDRHYRGDDGYRHHRHGYQHRSHHYRSRDRYYPRDAWIGHRPVSYYRGAPAYYYPARPVHYHYVGGHYDRHHGDCDRAFLWIGGAMVLTELVHHAHHGH